MVFALSVFIISTPLPDTVFIAFPFLDSLRGALDLSSRFSVAELLPLRAMVFCFPGSPLKNKNK
jgi:hypothetical protein